MATKQSNAFVKSLVDETLKPYTDALATPIPKQGELTNEQIAELATRLEDIADAATKAQNILYSSVIKLQTLSSKISELEVIEESAIFGEGGYYHCDSDRYWLTGRKKRIHTYLEKQGFSLQSGERLYKVPPVALFKVTSRTGAPLHGGSGKWPLPKLNEDGTWTPGEWREIRSKAVTCQSGLHFSDAQHIKTWASGSNSSYYLGTPYEEAVWLVEVEGWVMRSGDDRKWVARKARLVRQVPHPASAAEASKLISQAVKNLTTSPEASTDTPLSRLPFKTAGLSPDTILYRMGRYADGLSYAKTATKLLHGERSKAYKESLAEADKFAAIQRDVRNYLGVSSGGNPDQENLRILASAYNAEHSDAPTTTTELLRQYKAEARELTKKVWSEIPNVGPFNFEGH